MPKRAEPPATVTASRKRAKIAPDSETASEVLEYLQRFRIRNEKNGTNARGGGTQTKTDEAIMTSLMRITSGKVKSMEERCVLLREFIMAYGVARCFGGLREDNVKILGPIVKALESSATMPLSESTEALSAACKCKFGRNPSFVSKVLCMLGRRVPIYSSEGIAFLGLKTVKSYEEFRVAWMAAYEPLRAAYEAEAEKQIRASGLEAQLGAPWFAMRGFDVHLMKIGGPMRKAK